MNLVVDGSFLRWSTLSGAWRLVFLEIAQTGSLHSLTDQEFLMKSFALSTAGRCAIACSLAIAGSALLPAFAAPAADLPSPAARVALNPQPLPPRASPTTSAVQQKGIIVQAPNKATATQQRGIIVQSPSEQNTVQPRGIIIVGGKSKQ